MTPIRVLWRKTVDTLRTSGVKVLIKKARNYIKKVSRLKKKTSPSDKVFMDVLFINGCVLPHPARYRVTHQREQLLANGITSNEVFFENVTLELVKRYRMFIIFRCPYTDMIGQFIKLAQEHHKTVLFDVDDLVIDRKYTDQIKYVQSMREEDRQNYDSGVERMNKTLCMCDGAITTTGRLAEELKNYVPEVYINRNVASGRMLELSEKAVYERDTLPFLPPEKAKNWWKRRKILELNRKQTARRTSGEVTIGYFSGSITHNDDIKMVLPVLVRLMTKYDFLKLNFVGELDLPEELEPFRSRIRALPFVDWEKLPELIAGVDINIAPIEDTIFNEAKSENKWTEAALVKVPTAASRVGAFKDVVEDGVTGLLCGTQEEWLEALSRLVEEPELRKSIGEQAFKTVRDRWCTVFSGKGLSDHIRGKMKSNLVMVIPPIPISGGKLVALKHCEMLADAGIDVTIFNDGFGEEDIPYNGRIFFTLATKETEIRASIDRAVATTWNTVDFLRQCPTIYQRYYLVQGFEPCFYSPGDILRVYANQTYLLQEPMKYITISRWCESWLAKQYGRLALYAPNGIELSRFRCHRRDLSGEKIRILIEGSCEDDFKNIDESFLIADILESNKYEIWYMSYQGGPKSWYRADRFLGQVPHEQVAEIYSQCDILLKSSVLESFSYPPLEMMATGGYAVVVPNEGNAEYLRDGVNCLFYEQGNPESAVNAIERLITDIALQQALFENGKRTAEERDWENFRERILALYDVKKV